MSARSAGGGRLRRTWPQRLLILFNAMCIVAALAGAGAISYAKRTVGQIDRVAISDEVLTPTSDLADGEPQNFLIVGVDSDEGLAADDPVRGGRDKGPEATGGTLRSDTIMVARVDPGETEAQILSFPRDLWVDIPGHGRDRINASITYGREAGPELLIRTIKENFDIDINHYVQVNFAGFKNLVDIVGGVPVYLANPVRDGRALLDIPEAGCVVLDSDQALAYARARHFQYMEDGQWKTDPTSDLGRISRQQDFIRRVIRRAIDKGARNPATLARMVNSGSKHIELDPFTTPGDLLALGRAFRDYDPDTLRSTPLPVADAWRGGARVLDLLEEQAEPILAPFRGTKGGSKGEDLVPADVTVRVINGTGTQNQATDVTNRLAASGFKVASPGSDANGALRTTISFPTGQQGAATVVARYLAADPVLVPDDTVAEVTVLTGPDLFAVLDQPRPVAEIPEPETTTTTTTTTSTTTPGPDGADGTGTSAGGTGTGAEPTEPEDDAPKPPGYLPADPPEGTSCG